MADTFTAGEVYVDYQSRLFLVTKVEHTHAVTAHYIEDDPTRTGFYFYYRSAYALSAKHLPDYYKKKNQDDEVAKWLK
jgi:hypothetical protein